ncbi:MAG: hypothetical protein DBY37_16100, partial [Desulfovibrionaceae bacterium]
LPRPPSPSKTFIRGRSDELSCYPLAERAVSHPDRCAAAPAKRFAERGAEEGEPEKAPSPAPAFTHTFRA